jgi:hypothetical protein
VDIGRDFSHQKFNDERLNMFSKKSDKKYTVNLHDERKKSEKKPLSKSKFLATLSRFSYGHGQVFPQSQVHNQKSESHKKEFSTGKTINKH